MKKYLGFFLLLILFCVSASAQKIAKPTLTPVAATPAQLALIQEGIKLHDRGMFDEAIQKYQQVLKENPDCTFALYEMAFSYYKKKDFVKFIDAASIGIQYKSDELHLFYEMIANRLDDLGKPQEAIQVYKDALNILEDKKEYRRSLSSLYYNMGVTYTRQKQYKEAREALKKSVENNFAYPSPNYLLAVIFSGTKYKVPALLAAARLISLEINTDRTERSVTIFLDVLKSAKKDEKTGNINIFLDMDAPKDEGDFGMYDLILGTLLTVKSEKDKNKTENEIFAEAVDTLIALLSEDKKLSSTFVGKNYVPYMVEMKKRGYSKIFAYLVLQQNGNKEAEKWLIDNGQTAIDFINWSKTYQPNGK